MAACPSGRFVEQQSEQPAGGEPQQEQSDEHQQQYWFSLRAPPVLLGPADLMPGVHGPPDRAAGIEKYRPVPGWPRQPNNDRRGGGW